MILKNDHAEYYINDDILKNPAPIVYVKEIPSLRIDIKGDNIEGQLYNISVPHYTDEFKEVSDNIASIRVSPPFPHRDDIMDMALTYLRNSIKDENTKIFFDNLHEGHVIAPIIAAHKIIDTLNLNHKNCYFFVGGVQAQSLYDNYCQENNITNKINIRIINNWERSLKLSFLRDEIPKPVYKIAKKDKLFLCFNRMARKHRWVLLGLMYEKKLVEKSFYSFFTECYGSNGLDNHLDYLKSEISSYLHGKIALQINGHKNDFPLLLNTETVNDNVNYVKSDDDFYYQNSYFSLVTETFFFKTSPEASKVMDELSVFFSEKIFKPIMCKHPFIMLNRPKALEFLRKLGYKTFHPFIDESYDLIENDEDRMIAIADEIERLSKQTDEEWIKWQMDVKSIVEFNYQTLLQKDIKEHTFHE